MSQWKSNANTSGAPKFASAIFQQGSGAANKAANNIAMVVNVTPGAWKTGNGQVLNEADGIFPVTPGAKANTSGESKKIHALGWAIRTASEGPITTFVAANGSGFVNGDTVTVSGGSVNAIVKLTTNATGNLVSGAVFISGLFTNTSAASKSFNRDQHATTLIYANASAALTNVGNGNTINVTVVSNAVAWGVNAVGSFTSNATGGFGTSPVTVTWTSNGVFANTANTTNLTAIITNAANGAAIGSITSSGLNLSTSTGGFANVTALGGRAGRVTWEVLVVDRHINATATSSVANSVYLPQ